MDFAVLINQILVLFTIIILGYILRKRKSSLKRYPMVFPDPDSGNHAHLDYRFHFKNRA